jgi:hypothetical protein
MPKCAHAAADPILAAPEPSVLDEERWTEYRLHLSDAWAPLGFAAIVRRLAGFIEAAPPSEWQLHHYDWLTEVVAHMGFRRGQSFLVHLDHEVGLTFLIERAETAGPNEVWNYTMDALALARSGKALGATGPRLLWLWRAQIERMLALDDDVGAQSRVWLRACGAQLGAAVRELAAISA